MQYSTGFTIILQLYRLDGIHDYGHTLQTGHTLQSGSDSWYRTHFTDWIGLMIFPPVVTGLLVCRGHHSSFSYSILTTSQKGHTTVEWTWWRHHRNANSVWLLICHWNSVWLLRVKIIWQPWPRFPLSTPVFSEAGRDEHGQDWIGLDQDWSQFWPNQDWIGLHFFFNWRIRTGSDWENFSFIYVIILNIPKF